MYRKYVTGLVVMSISIVGAIAVLLGLAMRNVWPNVVYWFQQTFGSVQAVCGCDYTALSQSQGIMQFGVALTGIVVLWIVWSAYKLFTIARKTYVLRRAMHGSITNTTYIRGVAVHTFSSHTVHALTVGWWNPHVYISSAALQRVQGFTLLALLQHEVSHARHKDPLWRAALSIVLPWLTPESKAIAQFSAWQEVAADESANTHYIQEAYIEMHTRQFQRDHSMAASYFSVESMRIDHWLGEPLAFGHLLRIVIALVASLLFASSALAISTIEIPPDVVHSCQQIAVMCNEIMSTPPMSLSR